MQQKTQRIANGKKHHKSDHAGSDQTRKLIIIIIVVGIIITDGAFFLDCSDSREHLC